MDFSELSYQSEVRDSLDKILAQECTPDNLKKFDEDFKHNEQLTLTANKERLSRFRC